jgi:hypothetical protein
MQEMIWHSRVVRGMVAMGAKAEADARAERTASPLRKHQDRPCQSHGVITEIPHNTPSASICYGTPLLKPHRSKSRRGRTREHRAAEAKGRTAHRSIVA